MEVSCISKLVFRYVIALAMMSVCMLPAWSKIAPSEPSLQIRRVLDSQADAWNRGDLNGFMSSYANLAETSYISGDTELYGFDEIKKRYETKYGNHADTMGKLDFADLRIVPLGAKNALCIGHWHLVREGKPDLRGVFSLVFVRLNNDWKILHDHTTALQ